MEYELLDQVISVCQMIIHDISLATPVRSIEQLAHDYYRRAGKFIEVTQRIDPSLDRSDLCMHVLFFLTEVSSIPRIGKEIKLIGCGRLLIFNLPCSPWRSTHS